MEHMDITASRRTASWDDVDDKAERLLISGAYSIRTITDDFIDAVVYGDNGAYDTHVTAEASEWEDNPIELKLWTCTCPWGQWCNSGRRPHDGPLSTGSVKSNNRPCSHAFAMMLLLEDA